MHIAIAGNIGAGKTSLTQLLAYHYGWEPHFEDVDENPYLVDFYDDMKRWAFNLQVYFLKSRFSTVLQIHQSGKTVIQDRTIYEDAYIFAPNLFDMSLMNRRDFDNYVDLFELMSKLFKAPDLLIYRRASVPTLVKQIQLRGREYESNLRLDYLKNLNDRYNDWIDQYDKGKLLIINVDELDFIKNKADLSTIIDKVDAHINGLF
jgi:deoxyadenosine/deoxycytidine kinase